MSAIRVRSSRFRSLLLVVGACQSAGRSAASCSSSARLGSGGAVSAWRPQGVFGVGQGGEFGFPPGFQCSCDQPVLRFDGVEGAFGAVGVVAGAFDGELGGAAEAVVPVGDLVGGGQRERDLGRVERGQQPVGDRVVDGGRGDRAARRGGEPVGAARALVGRPLVAVVVGAHRLAAGPADDDALTQAPIPPAVGRAPVLVRLAASLASLAR